MYFLSIINFSRYILINLKKKIKQWFIFQPFNICSYSRYHMGEEMKNKIKHFLSSRRSFIDLVRKESYWFHNDHVISIDLLSLFFFSEKFHLSKTLSRYIILISSRMHFNPLKLQLF